VIQTLVQDQAKELRRTESGSLDLTVFYSHSVLAVIVTAIPWSFELTVHRERHVFYQSHVYAMTRHADRFFRSLSTVIVQTHRHRLILSSQVTKN